MSAMEGVVAPRVLDAMRTASDELTRLEVRHALVGRLAVAGIDRARCRAWLATNAPVLEDKFEELVERAERESE